MNEHDHTHTHVEQQNKVAGNVIIALIAGLILGFIAGSAWASHKAALTGDMLDTSDTGSTTMMVGTSTDMMTGTTTSDQTSMNSDISAPSMTTNGSGSVTVADQAAGNSVTLSNVNLSQAGWVAVRDNFTGKPEYILGAAWFAAGSQNNVTVHLSRATVPGTSYQIVLFKDAGDHVFNYTADNLINADGNPVVATFTVR